MTVYGSGWFREGETSGTTIYESDEIYVSKVLQPNGEPYTIRKPPRKIGFIISPSNLK
jgi:hypothetical protein